MHRPFEKKRREKENPTIKQKSGMPSVHQWAAFFCTRHGHMRCAKRKR